VSEFNDYAASLTDWQRRLAEVFLGEDDAAWRPLLARLSGKSVHRVPIRTRGDRER